MPNLPNEISKYLGATRLCDFDREIVSRKASEITSGAKSSREKSARILDFWKNTIKFEYGDWDVSASAALEKGSAMCAAKNIGSVAMHRYLGIPARARVLKFDIESKLWEYAARWDPWLAEKTKLIGKRRDHVVHEVYLDGRWERHDVTRDSALEAGMKVYGMPSETETVPEETQVFDFDRWAFERQKKVHIREERAEFHKRLNILVQIIRETGELVTDRENDASELAKKAVRTLKNAAEWSKSEEVSGFSSYLTEVGKKLTETRPDMASISNLVAKVLFEVLEKSTIKKDVRALRKSAISVANNVIADAEKATSQAARRGADLIENGDRVITCGYSSTLNEMFRVVKEQGKEIEVVIAESRLGDKRYGKLTAQKLTGHGIRVRVVPDNAIRHNLYTLKVKNGFVGANSILSDACLVSRWPAYWLALVVKDNNLPFYAIGETTRFNPRLTSQDIKPEAGISLIPGEWITGVVTEEGIAKPTDLGDYMARLRQYLEILQNKAG